MNIFLPFQNVTELTTFYRLIFWCSNYSNIILLYENSTIPILEPILLGLNGHSSIVINIDLEQHHNYTNVYSDENSLIISVFDNNLVKKADQLRQQYGFKPYCHYLFVSMDINENELNDKLMTFAVKYKLDNIVMVSLVVPVAHA